MSSREEAIRDHFEGLGFHVEWVRLPRGSNFLLAWKGKEVQVIFADLRGVLAGFDAEGAREEFLQLLSHLISRSSWDRVFKGRDVHFRWLTFIRPLEAEKKILKEAGVEPFFFTGNGGEEAL